mmetsp:Transcript_13387/g.20132  ORF Transcript_13387/g.20132 Transcript_13387/m.20132 type:complete len:391 (+) Transcript_13387:36-1208(+)
MAEKKPKTLKRKQRLLEGMTIDDLLDGWTQCCFYMKNKRRLCNIGRSPGSMYCGNHRLTSDDIPARVLNDAKAVGSTEITRIPCPIDPSHTIFSHNVNAHIKVCNTGARNALMEKQPYFCKDCNTGYNVKCASPSPVNVDDLVRKVRNCYHTKVQPEMQEPTSQGTVSVPEADIMEAVGGTSTAFAKIRHARQNVCIVREMTAEGLISTDPHPSERRPTAYVELGAGKGMLGLAVKTAAGVSGSRLVMVERMGVHRKADKTLREKNDNSFVRVRMDIRDCLLSRLPGVSTLDAPGEKEGRVVLIAKHLCGLATDITLRSLSCFPVADDGSLPEDVQGVALATCCHHACSWEDYVAVDWLKDQGFTSDDFEEAYEHYTRSHISTHLLYKHL